MNSVIKFIRKRLRVLKVWYLEISDRFFPVFQIDYGLLTSNIATYNLEKVTTRLQNSYQEIVFDHSENAGYFTHILNYINSDKYLRENPFFIYPPNVAAIDFIIKNIDKDAIIIDYGSGLGNLLVYLKNMGFENTFGYDTYSQIKQETIEHFLTGLGLPGIMVSKKQALALPANVILCIGYFWSKLEKEILVKEIENPKLQYILIDYRYAPRFIKNFKIAGIYKNLLVVFTRK